MFFTGSHPYQGILFTTAEELLTALKNNLLVAGWTLVNEDTTSLLVAGTTTNNHSCYILFSVDNIYLQIQGDWDGTNSNLSPILNLEFTPNSNNRFWLTADGDSGAICLRNRYFYSGAIANGCGSFKVMRSNG